MADSADVTVTLFHPAVWGIVAVIVIPLLGGIGWLLIHQIRLLDARVINLCRQVARLEGLLGVVTYRNGLQDALQEPLAPCPPPDDDEDADR